MEQEKVDLMPPQKTWFFSDSSGRIFPANEKEAFNLLTENSRWRRQDIKMVGMSDGKTYHETIKGASQKTKDLVQKIAELKETLQKYISGHDKLLFEQFVEKDDPRIVRANALIKEVEDEIAPLEVELKELRTNLVQTAFNAELEKARGNLVNPRDFSVIAKSDGTSRGDAILQGVMNSKRVI
jgi:hypothetical protein